ncbi:hypothetical protein CEE37_09620 [candidate division LCP-89 bacterium B3_LCP]|uniref:Secretion system C-terminal sorting domain-containing protein n=1 Tax=candidate division LCP-89 bacterium B3_LCP TaxID=2012998 RepID=A0A532UYE9_UNCL8|nr:MAG: hypothetical protein CEE37_09620 [candidate division LCP-89 bacterium B3_LCP]
MFRNILIVLTQGLLVASIASAQTIIPGGHVSGIWDTAGSPYMIEGNITIPSSETLIVDPGVEVYFQGRYEWMVNGWLEAIGTVTDSILITAQDTSNRWLGITFDSAPDSSYLEYCIIEYTTYIYPTAQCGGIVCGQSTVISHCTIRFNIGFEGAAIGCGGSSRITHNDIIYNGSEAQTKQGGGILIGGGSPIIMFNNISENIAYCEGGGIWMDKGCDAMIKGNYITGNTVSSSHAHGGGIYCSGYSSPTMIISENIIVGNTAIANCFARGGGLCGGDMNIGKNTIYNNSARGYDTVYGGGICTYVMGNTVTSSIFWSNSPDQIYSYGSTSGVTYSDIQDGWPGIGNIAENPMFINPELYDFRLQWGSPCIDAGDPDPQYNDADGTRADMGAFYYDQSIPVRVLSTRHDWSIVIPPEGDSFEYTLTFTCIDPQAPRFTTWMDVTLPNGTIFGPVMGPVEAELDSGVTVRRERTQVVPAGAERGLYSYNSYAVVESDTSFDSFEFFKLGSDGSDGKSGWTNTGEPLDFSIYDEHQSSILPEEYKLFSVFPNPFNPNTVISFELRVSSLVNLAIYDISGRLVAELVNGWRDAGTHEVTFDGSNLASGIYIYQLDAGGFTASGKMVMMK